MKTFTDFALKEEHKLLQSGEDELDELDALIDWKSFRIMIELTHSNKEVFDADLRLM